jgi:hypothetical protein
VRKRKWRDVRGLGDGARDAGKMGIQEAQDQPTAMLPVALIGLLQLPEAMVEGLLPTPQLHTPARLQGELHHLGEGGTPAVLVAIARGQHKRVQGLC